MTPRRFIGVRIARLATAVSRAAFRLSRQIEPAGDRAWLAIMSIAARVSDCGCDHEDAECCGAGEWCECKCHEQNEVVS